MQVLKSSPFPQARCNAIIALGDLAFRFPNLIEPWTDHLYARLKDEDDTVRLNAVMVLTHLILNDMVKVKGQISNLAVCLEDGSQRIGDLSRLFFSELSNKGNAIYNVMPDVISHVSHEGVSEEKMKRIMTFLFSFIKKDRHAESLVDKLCQRFRTTHDVTHWRGFAFCLSLINYSDRCLKKLTEQLPCYQDKLGDEAIHACFQEILSKAGKFAKPETKELLGNLEQRIAKGHEQGAEGAAVAAAAAAAKKKSKRQGGAGTRRRTTSTRSTRSTSETGSDSCDDDEDGDGDGDGDGDQEQQEEQRGDENACAQWTRKGAGKGGKQGKGKGKQGGAKTGAVQRKKAVRKHGIRSSQLEDSDESDLSDLLDDEESSDCDGGDDGDVLQESDGEMESSRIDARRKRVQSRRKKVLRSIQEDAEDDVLLA